MYHFFDALTQKSGLSGYYCRVIDPATGGVVTMAADANGTPISTISGIENMCLSDDAGNFNFYVDPGNYHLDIYNSDATTFNKRVANVPMGDPDAVSRAELAASDGAESVGVTLPSLLQTRSLAARAEDRVSLFDNFSSAQRDDVRNGALTQNIRTQAQEVLSAYKNVFVPDGQYWLGDYTASLAILDLRDLGDDITIETDGGSEMVCRSATFWQPEFITCHANNNLSIGRMRFRDLGGDPDTMNGSVPSPTGAVGIAMHGTYDASIAGMQNINIASVYGNRLIKVVDCNTGDATHRVRNINIGQLFSDDCYYGLHCNENGDAINVDLLSAYQNKRCFYVHGVKDVTANIHNRNARQATAQVNIARLNGGLDTTGISVEYFAEDMALDITHVMIDHIDLLGGRIQGVKVHFKNLISSTAYDALRFVNYTGSGGTETAAASSNIVTDISITGSVDSNARPIAAVASYASVGALQIAESASLKYASSVSDKFAVNQNRPAQSTKTTNFTLDLTQTGQVYYTGAAATASIPTNASAAFPIGAKIEIVNNGFGALAIARNSGVALKWSPGGTDADRSLAVGGVAMLRKVATDTWFISGAGLS